MNVIVGKHITVIRYAAIPIQATPAPVTLAIIWLVMDIAVMVNQNN